MNTENATDRIVSLNPKFDELSEDTLSKLTELERLHLELFDELEELQDQFPDLLDDED